MSAFAQPRLYGIHQSNRKPKDLWGKNQFNSTFPTALACYMRDANIHPVFLSLNADSKVATSEISVNELFNSDRPNEELRFDFESKFEPYQRYANGDIGGIDLVIRHSDDPNASQWRRALEVKLTVLPDNATSKLTEDQWGCELVIRPASMKYCALGIIDSLSDRRDEVREVFADVCGKFDKWDSGFELTAKRPQLISALEDFQHRFKDVQKPFLMQPIWKTQGKTPILSENAFDIFVWSDFALCQVIIDRSKNGSSTDVDRFMRSAARLARTLYELSRSGLGNINTIYTEMTFGTQTDKDFALPGKLTRAYMNSPRRVKPALTKDVIVDVILNGGQRMLSPERRLDACVYFTADSIFEMRAQQMLEREAVVDAMEVAGVDSATVANIVDDAFDDDVTEVID